MFYFILLIYLITNYYVLSYKTCSFAPHNLSIKASDGLEISSIYKKPNLINNSNNPIIFIHGSNAGGWIYDEYWLDYFSSKGYPSYSINMRGSNETGNLDSKINLNFIDHVQDLEDIIKYFNENIGKPIVVAHSYGGLVLTKFYENVVNRNSTLSSVWLSSLPPSGEKYLLPRFFLRKNILRVVNSALGSRLDSKIGINKLIFYDECTKDYDIEWFNKRFEKDSKYNLDRVSINENLPNVSKFKNNYLWENNNNLVIGSYDDFILDPFSVRETQKLINSKKPIFLRDSGHNMMLGSNWKDAADVILSFLKNY